MAFDPDAYLAGNSGTALADPPTATPAFDPDAYLKQSASIDSAASDSSGAPIQPWLATGAFPEIARNAADAAAETLSGFIPRSASQALEMLTPLGGAVREVKGSVKTLYDWVNGKPLEQAEREQFPDHFILKDAEQTPAGSKERFLAAFDVLANIGTGIAIAHGLAKPHGTPPEDITGSPKQVPPPTVFDPDAYLRSQPAAEEMTSETARVAPATSPLPESQPSSRPETTTAPLEPATEIPPTAYRPPSSDPSGFTDSPLVQFIRDDVGGILSRSAARDKWGAPKYEENASLWDDAPQLRNPRHNEIYNSRTGVAPDEAATAAADAGLLPPTATSTDLWRALQRESDAAHSRSAQVIAQRANERNAFVQDRAFATAIEQPIPGEKPIQGSDLNVGDTVKIGTEHMKVTALDPDTYDVTLEDGSKFGIQHVQDNQAIYGEVQRPAAEAAMWMEQEKITPSPEVPLMPQKMKVSEVDSPAQGALYSAREAKSRAWQTVQDLRAKVRDAGPQAGNLRLELLQAESAHKNIVRMEKAARQAIERRANELGQTTVSSPAGAGDVFGFGPGAASATEPLRLSSQIKQLTSTVTDSLRTAHPAPIQSRLQRVINSVGGKIVSVKESLGRGAQMARATWLTLKNGYLRPPIETGFKDVVKDWQGADQRTSFEVRKFAQALRNEVRDPLIRDAITNYIQADGDAALLRQRATASNIKYRSGYEAALNLTDAQKTLAANVRQYFDAMLQDGINAGVLDHGLENYITQIWKRPNKFTQQLQADLQAGKLQTNFQFARKRVFDSFFDGEQAGYAPASKDVSALVAAYDLSFNRSLAARGFVKALREARAADGEPVVKFSGSVQPIKVGDAPPEAYLIRARTRPESAVAADGRAYQIVDHPALRGWKLVVQEGAEKPAYYQADMLVHPNHAGDLSDILGRSAFRQGKLGMVVSPFLKLGAIAKQTKLSLSLFHLDQEGLHGLFHRVNPANLDRINFDDPAQWSLVRNGLQVADYHASELFAEGLRGGGLVSKIPVLGELQNRFNEFLFKDYIPRLKMTMALHALERNAKRYPTLAPDVLAELTARQGNAAFGELNYKLMGRNPTLQDFLRLTVLAPDFLEARSRFVGQALKPYGQEQRVALFLGAATMYVAGRALNQWLDNDPHWDKPFSVIYNGREYRFRTVMGDAAEVFLDPRRFFYNRLSPWLKTGVTVGTGRDYRGVKLSNWEQVKDALSWLVPIPLGNQENATVTQRILGSSGVQNKPAPTAIGNIYDAARTFREQIAKSDPKIAAEVKRAQQETYALSDYARLNRALADKDNEAAAQEIQTLIKEKGKTIPDLVKHYSSLPSQPFSGSNALEARFLQQMPPPQRAQYRAARNEQIGITQRFFQVLRVARTR